MLESLLVQNFQCHEKLEVAFDPGITTIVGESDVGKSAILRALRWLARNRPSGDGFVRRGAEGATVRLRIDGRAVLRRKGKDRNKYQIDGQVFTAFGQDVPAAIADFLNLGSVNFQSQLDAPFWFSLSPGEVSRELNAVVDLGTIDAALGRLAAWLRQTRAAAEVCGVRLREAKEREEALAWVPEADRQLAEAETLGREVAERQARLVALEALFGEVRRADAAAGELARPAAEGEALIARGEEARQARGQAEDLERILAQIHDAEEDRCRANDDRTKAEEAGRGRWSRCPFCQSPLTSAQLMSLTSI